VSKTRIEGDSKMQGMDADTNSSFSLTENLKYSHYNNSAQENVIIVIVVCKSIMKRSKDHIGLL
jgi:hypothetical protein